MTITNIDEFVNALGNNSTRIVIDKTTVANTSLGNFFSLWRVNGQPGPGAIPTTTAVCNDATVGGLVIPQQVSPTKSYLSNLDVVGGAAIGTLLIYDRLAHMGGLNATLTTSQTVGISLDTLLATSNLDQRKGDANYSDVEWFLEWYADTGATASNATINVTYDDNTSGNLAILAVGGTVRNTRMIPISNLMSNTPTANRYIMRVNTITLSASTGTAGNFGVTAVRLRSISNFRITSRISNNWVDLGIPEIFNNSCLFSVIAATGTSVGNTRATGKVIFG